MQNFTDKKIYKTDEILWDNEISANKTVILMDLIFAGFFVLFIILSPFNIFDINLIASAPVFGTCAGALVITAIIGIKFNGKKSWVKNFLLTALVLVFASLNFGLGFSMLLTIAIPVVMSCRYGSNKLTRNTIILTVIFFIIADVLTVVLKITVNYNWAIFQDGYNFNWDQRWSREVLNHISIGETLLATLTFSYIPKYLLFAMVSIVCYSEAKNSKNNLYIQAEETEKNTRIEADLALAANIQADLLPSDFTVYKDRTEFDIYATMTPAKEVGGDLYDFFMIDDNRLAVVIADVSGKGIPAALFMVTAKTLIKDHTNLDLSPKDVFGKVNKLLCENNKSGLFVTAWLGIVDLKSGKLTFVNAGHNHPILLHTDGSSDLIKERNGFVLAGRAKSVYTETEMQLSKGDRLFLYTDGVTEAKNPNKKMYGDNRLIEYLEGHGKEELQDVLNGLFEDVGKFADGEEQFDDITMLCLEYNGKKNI